MKVLFMCVANSARSQMAEGLARNVLGPEFEIQSAGSRPSTVNPHAIEVMKEIGIDLSNHHSKSVDDLYSGFLDDLDYVITLCAEEVCPVIVSSAKKLHWPMPDPAGQNQLSREEKLELFRTVRDAIQVKLESFKQELGQ